VIRSRLGLADTDSDAQLLHRVIEILSAGLDLDVVVQRVADLITETTSTDVCFVHLRGPAGDRLQLRDVGGGHVRSLPFRGIPGRGGARAGMEHFEIATVAEKSADFRRVLWTGAHTQLVVMTIPPGGEIPARVAQSCCVVHAWSRGARAGVNITQALNIWLIQSIVALGPPLGALIFTVYMKTDWGISLFFLTPLALVAIPQLRLQPIALFRITAFWPVVTLATFAAAPSFAAHREVLAALDPRR